MGQRKKAEDLCLTQHFIMQFGTAQHDFLFFLILHVLSSGKKKQKKNNILKKLPV